jgi:LCP family protein required for cell wall assembly
MRTTLKRSLRRAATPDGNGLPVLPPAPFAGFPHEPVSIYVQEPPARSTARLIGTILAWAALALVVVASGLGGGLYLYTHETLETIAAKTPAAIASSKDKNLHTIASPSEAATALIVGYDARQGADAAAGQSSRSDTIMLVRADPTTDTLSLLSFPRDLNVPIYCNGSDVPVGTDRINSAYARCTVQGTLDTVAHLTGLSINYVITLDFHGFKLLVNRLRGVYLDVDRRYINTHGGPGGFATIDLEPGYQKLDGQQALDFVRYRHTDSDFYRLARQQLFLDALKDRLATSLSLTNIPKVIGALKHSVEVVKPGAGAPSLGEIESYLGLGYHLPAGHLFRVTIPNLVDCGYLSSQVCGQPSDITSAVQSFEHPDVTLPQRANNAALGRATHVAPAHGPSPASISTLVLNGTTVPGLARDTSYKLALAGYHTVQLPDSIDANAPATDANHVYYDPIQPKAEAAAKQLQIALGTHTDIAPLPPTLADQELAAGNPLTIAVIGSAFKGEIVDPTAHVVATPPRQPPAVTNDPNASTSPISDVRTKLPFRPYIPNLISSGSRLSDLDPVRAFKPAPGRHELAVTFVTPDQRYWQIIETDWTDAPILRKPTGKYTLSDGRKLDLYTNGGTIHMVVLHRGNATYWVVNTLRDELSNETMLAIGKGLQPLGQ